MGFMYVKQDKNKHRGLLNPKIGVKFVAKFLCTVLSVLGSFLVFQLSFLKTLIIISR